MITRLLVALVIFGLVGGGIGWLWHPGAGMAAAGILAFMDLNLPRKREP